MKKYISILATLAFAAGFVGCSSENDILEETHAPEVLTIKASTNDAATRTALNGVNVVWSEGDKIFFQDEKNLVYNFTLSKGAGTTEGEFTLNAYNNIPGPGKYRAYYAPGDGDTNNYTGYYSRQLYVNDKDITCAAMETEEFTIGADGEIPNIQFKNKGGILSYTVKDWSYGSDYDYVRSITLTAEDSIGNPINITLDCGEHGAKVDFSGTVFNIAIPEGTYKNASLYFETTMYKDATKTAEKLEVKKNTIHRSTFSATDFMYEEGKKVRIGETDAIILRPASHTNSRFYAVACRNLGTTDWKDAREWVIRHDSKISGWHLPDFDEFASFAEQYEIIHWAEPYEGTSNVTREFIYGKDAGFQLTFANGNTLFWPVVNSDAVLGFYWTSTSFDKESAYAFVFASEYVNTTTGHVQPVTPIEEKRKEYFIRPFYTLDKGQCR